jgi:hypothetical protein
VRGERRVQFALPFACLGACAGGPAQEREEKSP